LRSKYCFESGSLFVPAIAKEYNTESGQGFIAENNRSKVLIQRLKNSGTLQAQKTETLCFLNVS